MMSHLAKLIIYGLVITTIEDSLEEEMPCTMIRHEDLDPVIFSLEVLAKTEQPFNITLASTQSKLIWNYLLTSKDCKSVQFVETEDRTVVKCQFRHLLGKFNVKFMAQQSSIDKELNITFERITVGGQSDISDSCRRTSYTCGMQFPTNITCKTVFCGKCRELSCLSKDITTTTTATTISSSTPIDAHTTPTPIDVHPTSTPIDAHTISGTDKEFQVSDVIIASLLSFLGGVLFTLFTLVMYQFISQRISRHRSEDNKTKAAKTESKEETSQMTYETLKSTECASTEHMHTDHVYLGLGTESSSNKLSTMENVGEKACKTGSCCSSKQVYETTNEVKQDHVYNALTPEGILNVYESKIAEGNEHTYTGLTDRSPEDINVKQESSDYPKSYNESHNYYTLQAGVKGNAVDEAIATNEDQDTVYESTKAERNEHTYTGLTYQSPEDVNAKQEISDYNESHNYYTLQAEDRGNTVDEAVMRNEDQDKVPQITAMTGVDSPSSDHEHAYFTLQSAKLSDCPQDIERNDEASETEINSDGHTYQILERV